MNELVTLETEVEDPRARYRGIDAKWAATVQASEAHFDNRYMTGHPREVVSGHPEGGCVDLHRVHDTAWGVHYDKDKGFYCWGPKRPDLFEAEAERPAGSDLFAAFYGEVPAHKVGAHLPPSVDEPGLSSYPLYMDSQAYRERAQLEGFFGRVKRAFTPPRAVRRVVARAVKPPAKVRRAAKKVIRYGGAALATIPITPFGAAGAFMPASMRNRMFGLKGKDADYFEKAAKAGRAAQFAVASVFAGGLAQSVLAGAPKVAGTVGAAKSGSWVAKIGSNLVAIAKSPAGELLTKVLRPEQIPPGTELPAQGNLTAYDPSYDMTGGLLNSLAPSVAGAPSWTDTGFNDPSLTETPSDSIMDAQMKEPPPSSGSAFLFAAVIGAAYYFARGRK